MAVDAERKNPGFQRPPAFGGSRAAPLPSFSTARSSNHDNTSPSAHHRRTPPPARPPAGGRPICRVRCRGLGSVAGDFRLVHHRCGAGRGRLAWWRLRRSTICCPAPSSACSPSCAPAAGTASAWWDTTRRCMPWPESAPLCTRPWPPRHPPRPWRSRPAMRRPEWCRTWTRSRRISCAAPPSGARWPPAEPGWRCCCSSVPLQTAGVVAVLAATIVRGTAPGCGDGGARAGRTRCERPPEAGFCDAGLGGAGTARLRPGGLGRGTYRRPGRRPWSRRRNGSPRRAAGSELLQACAAGLAAMLALGMAHAAPLPMAALATLGAVMMIDGAASYMRGLQRRGTLLAAEARLDAMLAPADAPAGASIAAMTEPPAIALLDIPVRLAPGALVGISGPSGCGKTTFIEQLLKLRDIERDRIRLGGVEINDLDPGVGAPLLRHRGADRNAAGRTRCGTTCCWRGPAPRGWRFGRRCMMRRWTTACAPCPTAWIPGSARMARGFRAGTAAAGAGPGLPAGCPMAAAGRADRGAGPADRGRCRRTPAGSAGGAWAGAPCWSAIAWRRWRPATWSWPSTATACRWQATRRPIARRLDEAAVNRNRRTPSSGGG